MRKLILATVSAAALFGVAACSDTDNTTTQAVEPPATNEPATPQSADEEMQAVPEEETEEGATQPAE
jgi:negative regulator of sigma E activity